MRQHPILAENHFSLGLFSTNTNGGLSANVLPESWKATWENCIAIAKMADDAGLELLLPINRWIGFGGVGFQEEGMEPIVWATALGQVTKQIALVSTIHVPMFAPVLAAKQLAAVDQLLQGRFGLNIVCGWNQQEAELFGTQFEGRDKQYDMAQEWLNIVRGYWRRDAEPEYEGDFYHLKHLDRAQGPGSYDGDPLILNAAFSPKGREFAARNADFLFSSPLAMDADGVATIKANASKFGRKTGVIGMAQVICRPTRAEAEEYRRHVLENADQEAIDNEFRVFGMYNPRAAAYAAGVDEGQSVTDEQHVAARNSMILGQGSFELCGSPDDIADGIAQMASAGYSGSVFSLINYLDELPLIRDEVIPRLEARGIRQPTENLALT